MESRIHPLNQKKPHYSLREAAPVNPPAETDEGTHLYLQYNTESQCISVTDKLKQNTLLGSNLIAVFASERSEMYHILP
jgi:hypothetical protein